MHRSIIGLAIGTSLAIAAPAEAKYVKVTYTGTVAQTSTDAPSSIAVGTPITVQAVYDTAKMLDRDAAAFDAANGADFTSLFSASLADDPKASLSITIGSVSFSKFDQINYGTPGSDCGPDCDYGVGNFPLAYEINGAFAGVGNILINSQGYSIDPDPIADYFSGGFGLDGPGAGPFNFFVGRGDVDNPFTQGYAVGNFDLSTLTVQAVPELATWAMLITGFGVIGFALRRAGRRGPVAAFGG